MSGHSGTHTMYGRPGGESLVPVNGELQPDGVGVYRALEGAIERAGLCERKPSSFLRRLKFLNQTTQALAMDRPHVLKLQPEGLSVDPSDNRAVQV